MLKLMILLALLAVAGIEGPPLNAQMLPIQFFAQPDEPDPVPPPPGVDPEGWSDEAPPPRPARVCKKMCANDFSPCDPIYFKTEDGRCDGIDVGR